MHHSHKEIFLNYITGLQKIHDSNAGVKETSYYPVIETLLSGLGKSLKPEVTCIINPASIGSGIPDGGLFTKDQMKSSIEVSTLTVTPSRGVMEVKGATAKLDKIAASTQVDKYLERYGLVLVTNLWGFLLVGKENDKVVPYERFELAKNEKDFWNTAEHPEKIYDDCGGRFIEFLKRILLYNAPLNTPQDLAWFLASYARDTLIRVEKSNLDALNSLKQGLEESLGLKFEGEKGDHFFQSTLVQTLFYGMFSAWVIWIKQQSGSKTFNWHETGWYLRVPAIQVIFEQVATPTKLISLGLTDPLDWAAAALNRVNKTEFFQHFEEDNAVQYFYEPFLEAFDPLLRKELGVWYTPKEIVQYMIARIDTVLREELNIADGFADERVFVLDPCCGTGTFILEVLNKIAETLKTKGDDALLGTELKAAAQKRIFGFEIMPAPYVVAHLQLGVLLQNLGVPFKEDERAGVYLTNALTGWEPEDDIKKELNFRQLTEERDAANSIKQQKPILVILGNPPYNAYAGTSTTKEEIAVVKPYKEGLIKIWGIKKFNLDDLYVRFFRMAEKHIVSSELGEGILCYISNFSYLREPSFVVMRQHLINGFDNIWIDSLNGDSRQTGKTTPEGDSDPSVFSTISNKAGIKKGTSIGLYVRKKQDHKGAVIHFRQFWGVNKRNELLTQKDIRNEIIVTPNKENKFSFYPNDISVNYQSWPTLEQLSFFDPIQGLDEGRAGDLVGNTSLEIENKLQLYFDASLDFNQIKDIYKGITRVSARFEPETTRKKILALNLAQFSTTNIKRYLIRPFDIGYCYYSQVRPLWLECRPSLAQQLQISNTLLKLNIVINCLIVDDEPIAREGLIEHVRQVDYLTVAAQCKSAIEAASMLQKAKIDLIFIDIQMPKLTGIEFVKALASPPLIIFTTAYSEYALEGFELDVVDYLLKPISFYRFLKAAEKAQSYFQARDKEVSITSDFFFIKCNGKIEKIMMPDVLYIEGMANYVVIHTRHKKYITYLTFTGIEAQLPANLFVRIHKSYLVAIAAIQTIDGAELSIESGTLPISKNYKNDIMDKIDRKLFKR